MSVTSDLVSAYDSLEVALESMSRKFRNVRKVSTERHVAMNFGILCKMMPNLTSLDLYGIQLRKGVSLDRIGEFKQLKQLNLGGSNVRNELLLPIIRCTALETLDLWRTHLGHWNLEFVLPSLKNLTNLNLGYTKLQDTPMDFLASLTGLQFLDLGNTAVGSHALQSVASLVNLKSLFLDYTKIDDIGMQYLSSLTKLVDLNLGNTNITDAGLSYLTPLTQLMDLKLGHTTISDVGLIHFSSLCNLMYVYLDGTNVRDTGVNYLTTIMPQLHVQIRLDTSGIQF